MKDLVLIVPEKPSSLLEKMIDKVIGDRKYDLVRGVDSLGNLKNKKILFAVELNEIGVSNTMNDIFEKLYDRGDKSLLNSEGALLVKSKGNLFSKTFSQSLVFLANNLGCSFVGRPLVEATKDLDNLIAMKNIYDLPLEDICMLQCEGLGDRFFEEIEEKNKAPKRLLALHSSKKDISNTLTLWHMVKDHLKEIEIEEINLGDGDIEDCKGCTYKACKHFGSQGRCFYGGLVVSQVYPAILNCDSLMLISPNYNDMVTANLVASINRLTALFRKTKFYDKQLFSIIVSGYSGSDGIAKQLISSLNMNKTFRLPPYFALMETANDRGAILDVGDIENKARVFAENIMHAL